MSELASSIAQILYSHPNQHHFPPLPTRSLHPHIAAHALDRSPIHLPNEALDLPGLSPKKMHEVVRMSVYIRRLLDSLGVSSSEVYIVDVGAGQGYLCRSLRRLLHCPNILALDSDFDQSSGARSWDHKTFDHHVISHKTLHITPCSLLTAIDEWIPPNVNTKAQVLLVALHACGSLTIDALRAFLAPRTTSHWSFIAAVTVGCCYNLLNPTDYPLCKSVNYASQALLPHPLPPSAYHLAAQSPPTWSLPSFQLSVRKVVWRALVSPLLQSLPPPETSRPFIPPSEYTAHVKKTPAPRQNLETISAPSSSGDTGTSPVHQRLGRLPNSAYTSWESFLSAVEARLGVPLDTIHLDLELAKKLEELHIMRCRLGPLIESTILKDRIGWLKEELDQEMWSAELVNLFDQKISPRNVAIVVVPNTVDTM
ncbi:hypothetical protein VKT23_003918 [Stygiomarasmius scandens]|uniref:Methyltransferase domain-containing protein n=1 Tax=Marasmiellus scandens TaxID=2682957 RepID=A0ABR1K0B7_9AGAR